MDDDGPILVPTLMNEEPAFLVIFGTKDISLRQVLTMIMIFLFWFVFGWMALGSIFGSPLLGLLALGALPVLGIVLATRTKGNENMTYEEWLAYRLNYLLSPRYYVREDQQAVGSPDMEMLVWDEDPFR